MKIYYGIMNNKIDVTDICMKLIKNDKIIIPYNDIHRIKLFTDPLIGIKKKIIIEKN